MSAVMPMIHLQSDKRAGTPNRGSTKATFPSCVIAPHNIHSTAAVTVKTKTRRQSHEDSGSGS